MKIPVRHCVYSSCIFRTKLWVKIPWNTLRKRKFSSVNICFVHTTQEKWILHSLVWDICLGKCTEWKISDRMSMERTVLHCVLRCMLPLLWWQKFFFHDLEKISFPNECWDDCLVLRILREKECFQENKLTTLPISVPWVNLSLQNLQRKLVRHCVFWDVRLRQGTEEIVPYTIRKEWIVFHCAQEMPNCTSAMSKPSWTYLARERSSLVVDSKVSF
jgi:hypothetical protein